MVPKNGLDRASCFSKTKNPNKFKGRRISTRLEPTLFFVFYLNAHPLRSRVHLETQSFTKLLSYIIAVIIVLTWVQLSKNSSQFKTAKFYRTVVILFENSAVLNFGPFFGRFLGTIVKNSEKKKDAYRIYLRFFMVATSSLLTK